jgi:hypothetical protein
VEIIVTILLVVGAVGLIIQALIGLSYFISCIWEKEKRATPHAFKPQPHPVLKGKKCELSPEEATERVKGYARNRGADLVGITQVNPLWFYSHRGEIFHENWEDWGKEINVEHKYAVVFATEMSFDMVGTGPHSPTMIESMGNYAQGAYIATQLAQFITNLGYSATASHLRHYEALMVR